MRFFLLSKKPETEFTFDVDLAQKHSEENPVFYVQYCYARIFSVFRNLNKNIKDPLVFDKSKLKFNNNEIKIFRKISEWPKCIEISTKKLEPHRITTYLYELSAEFHHYWNLGKDDHSFRFIVDNKISKEKEIFLKIILAVIKSGMNILGVDTPEQM